jgi:thymidylate kinase
VIAVDRVEAAGEQVLVFGSLPPHGRDLDLLVRSAAYGSVAAALRDGGFQQRGHRFARFDSCSVEAVELVAAERWGLPDEELAALFAEARPLPGLQRLMAPAAHHQLLILARRFARDGRLDAKRRGRVAVAVAEDPDAWRRAGQRAAAWGATRAVAIAEAAYAGRGPAPTLSTRADALAEQSIRAGRSPRLTARLRAWRTVLGSRRRGAVIAMSGLDGSGKTSQAVALCHALDRLGFEPITEWTRLAANPSLDRIAGPVKRLLVGRLGHSAGPPAVATTLLDSSRLAEPAKRIRQRSRVMTAAWATVVSVANGWEQRHATVRHLRAGRIVVCDRYTLDSAVHLRYRYGETHRRRLQVRLIRLLSPTPLRSFYLDLSAETAFARKSDHYNLEQLRRQLPLYRQEHRAHGARCLDGERPQAELCAEIAADVWAGLHPER